MSGPYAVSGYLALSRFPGRGQTLEHGLSLRAALLAAELGECRWCIERCRHECRRAGIAALPTVSEREHAALEFVAAVARSTRCGGWLDQQILERARVFLADAELAELTAVAVEHHCLDPVTLNPVNR